MAAVLNFSNFHIPAISMTGARKAIIAKSKPMGSVPKIFNEIELNDVAMPGTNGLIKFAIISIDVVIKSIFISP